jgi:Domain of unknown function (DUF4421)
LNSMRYPTKRKLLTTLFFISTLHISLSAQKDTSQYIQSFVKADFVQLYTGLFSRQLRFISRNPVVKPEMREIMLASNAAAFIGSSLRYKKLNIYLETSLPNTYLVDRRKTKVKAYALFVNQFYSKWGITGFFSFNKGFLSGTSMPGRYADRNDLRMLTAGAHVYRIFNSKKFSYLAANSQGKLQLNSQGSFVLLTTVLLRRLYSTHSIIPDSLSKYHFTGSMESSKNLQFYSVLFKPGYVYNFVFKKGKYFISPALYMGMGADLHSFTTKSVMHTGLNLNQGIRFKIVAGINSKNYYTTLEFLSDKTTTFLYQTKIKSYYKELSLNLAYRF